MSFGDTVTVEGKSHIVVIVAKPFLVNGTGTYKLKFYVDDTPYELPFKLIDGPLTGPSTT